MLPNLKILMLLATIIAKSLSAPPEEICLPDDPERLKILIEALAEYGWTIQEFLVLLEEAPFLLGKSISAFSDNLMRALVERPEIGKKNIVVSPFSIHTALSMLYYASPMKSETNEQIAKALNLDRKLTRTYLLNFFKILDYYEKQDTGLELANKIFVRSGIHINLSYLTFLKGFYDTSAEHLDFDPEIAGNQINNYVSEKTHGMIEELVKPGVIKSTTSTVLVNAIYHKDNWEYEFDKCKTGPMLFKRLGDQGTFEYPYGMCVTSDELRLGYLADIDSMVVELPYKKRGFNMYIIVPDKNTLDALNLAATQFNFRLVQESLEWYDDGVRVFMPGFELDEEAELDEVMKALGMKDAFIPDVADFSHFTKNSLEVTDIITKAKVKVNEEGSECAASAGVVACTRTFGEPRPEELRVDRPFVFIIMDTHHGIPIFKGRIVNPAGDNQGALPIEPPNKQ